MTDAIAILREIRAGLPADQHVALAAIGEALSRLEAEEAEAAPLRDAGVAALARLVHFACVWVDGDAALRHEPVNHERALTVALRNLTENDRRQITQAVAAEELAWWVRVQFVQRVKTGDGLLWEAVSTDSPARRAIAFDPVTAAERLGG